MGEYKLMQFITLRRKYYLPFAQRRRKLVRLGGFPHRLAGPRAAPSRRAGFDCLQPAVSLRPPTAVGLVFCLQPFRPMPRILAIDYGNKRVGLAVTDPLAMIASPLETIHSKDLLAYVKAYHLREPLRAVVVGMPRTLLNEPTDVTSAVVGLLRTLRRELPELPIHELDERFTSRMAHATMLAGGLGQKARRDKATVDRISATIILQSFLESPLMREV